MLVLLHQFVEAERSVYKVHGRGQLCPWLWQPLLAP